MQTPIQSQSDQQLAIYGIIIIGAVAAIGLIGVTIVSAVWLRSQKGTDITPALSELLASNRTLQLITVAAVLMGLLFLGMTGKLTDGAIALLSSLGGYVLGALRQPNSGAQDRKHD